MGVVFVNYRAKDNPFAAAGIASMLADRFGQDRVFRDSVSMAAGDQYPAGLREGLERADVLVAVIGSRWHELADDQGRLLIQRDEDWVRWEIARAIERGIHILPVLLMGAPEDARPPDPEILPASIKELADIQAFEIRQRRLGEDLDRLADRLVELVPSLAEPRDQETATDRLRRSRARQPRPHQTGASAPTPVHPVAPQPTLPERTSQVEPDDATGADKADIDGNVEDSHDDLEEILRDSDLSLTRERIRTVREGEPSDPARALRLLDLVGRFRPVDRIIEDAGLFDERDAGQILGVAAIERSIPDAAEIMLAKWGSRLARDVVRTFARQRRTNDVAELITLLKRQEQTRQADAVDIISVILNEFAGGDTDARDGGHDARGRPVRDIALVHVHLVAAQCPEEAKGLLDRVFRTPWRPGFAYELDVDFTHDAPRGAVLDRWALATVSRGPFFSVIPVVGELLQMLGRPPHDPSTTDRMERLITSVGDQWPPNPLVALCVDLIKRDYGPISDRIRVRAARREDLWRVTELINVWWQESELEATRVALLDEVVNAQLPTWPARTAAQVDTLAEHLTREFGAQPIADLLRLRAALGVVGRTGTEIAELLGTLNDVVRRKAGPQVASGLALATKKGDVPTTTVAEYIRSLRSQNKRGSRQAADDARDALTSIAASEPGVVARVSADLMGHDSTKNDGLTILTRYLTNHAMASAQDVVSVFHILDRDRQPDGFRDQITDLARVTVGRWPPVRRREAAHELHKAGLVQRAEQVTPG